MSVDRLLVGITACHDAATKCQGPNEVAQKTTPKGAMSNFTKWIFMDAISKNFMIVVLRVLIQTQNSIHSLFHINDTHDFYTEKNFLLFIELFHGIFSFHSAGSSYQNAFFYQQIYWWSHRPYVLRSTYKILIL